MDLAELKKAVCEANLATVKTGLVMATFGNASGIDRENDLIAIKPSGVPYDSMSAEDMVTVRLDGSVLDNHYKPSSDLDTHLLLYRAFDGVGGVVHTHSTFATIFAQAMTPIPCFGTTHADYFRGTVPVTRHLTETEIADSYVAATGQAIIDTFADRDPMEIPAALVAGHGPFVWGRTPAEAAMNAQILEECARMAWHSLQLRPELDSLPVPLRDRHFLRKHGKAATYGQETST